MNDVIYAMDPLAGQSTCFAIQFVEQFFFEDVVARTKYELLDGRVRICRDMRQDRCGNQYAFVSDTNTYSLGMRRGYALVEDSIAVYAPTESGQTAISEFRSSCDKYTVSMEPRESHEEAYLLRSHTVPRGYVSLVAVDRSTTLPV